MERKEFITDTIPSPPEEFVNRIGGYDFSTIGEHLAELLVERCRIQPTDRVLDIGCGVGRLAIPLTRHLQLSSPSHGAARSSGDRATEFIRGAMSMIPWGRARTCESRGGTYDGIDLDAQMIAWCRKGISTRFPHFKFHHANLSNTAYQPNSGQSADTYTFPFPDHHFDVIFAFSLFTHLLPNSAARYASEIRRPLKPGGRALLTFLLITDDMKLDGSKIGEFVFKPQPGGYAVTREDQPEVVLALNEQVAFKLLTEAGLTIREVGRGTWSGTKDGWTYQDVVLLTA